MRKPDTSIRLAVTGLGIICAIGRNRDEVWSSIAASADGIAPMSRFPGERFPTDIAAEAEGDLSELLGFDRRQTRRLSRSDKLAVVAAREAIAQADDARAPIARETTAVCGGSSTGGLLEGESYFFRRRRSGRLKTPVSSVLQHATSGPSDAVANLFRLGGGVISNATACASAGAAIAIGSDLLRSGQADAVIAGGSDALCRLTYSGFNVLQAVDPAPCTPFSADRRGITLGEGAAWLVIERWEDALARGAKIVAEVAGFGSTCDAWHPTAPAEDGRGAAAALRGAMIDGDADASEIDYVNAHGTGTPLNDSAETRAIVASVGSHVPTSSTKSYFGHTLGASGALEAVVTILALVYQTAPPTLRLERVADDCVLDYIPAAPREMPLSAAISNTFGFGGSNISILFRRVETGR